MASLLEEGHQFRDIEVESMAKIMTCGTSAMGYKRYCCDNKSCTHSKVICFSCKSRFCNSCGQKATEQWITQQGEILPDCQYRHLTFTMPDVFWEVFKLNRQ